MKFSKIIILPTYNEEENLKKLIEIFKRDYSDFYLLIIDDSPNDLTKKIFDQCKYENAEIIKRGKKLGRGSAVRYGFEYAVKKDFSIIVEMDSDFSHDPHELKKLVDHFMQNNHDLVIGSRYLKESKIINWGFKRILFSKLANFFAKVLFNFPIKDYTNGYRVYNLSLVKKIIQYKQINPDFIYLTETLIIAFKNNFKCSEKPITFVNRVRGKSSVNFKGIKNSFFGIIKLKINSKNI